MNDLAALKGSYMSLTTFRRDATPVATPVWFVAEASRVLVMTSPSTGKVKRIRRDPHVTMATCSARGTVKGPVVEGTAEILGDLEAERAVALFERKYRVALVFVRPLRAWQRRRHPERDTGTTILAISPRATEEALAA